MFVDACPACTRPWIPSQNGKDKNKNKRSEIATAGPCPTLPNSIRKVSVLSHLFFIPQAVLGGAERHCWFMGLLTGAHEAYWDLGHVDRPDPSPMGGLCSTTLGATNPISAPAPSRAQQNLLGQCSPQILTTSDMLQPN